LQGAAKIALESVFQQQLEISMHNFTRHIYAHSGIKSI